MTVSRPMSLGVGAVGGAVGALLGGGTGVVTVPVLERLTGLRRNVIHGTANLVNVAVAVIGGGVYALRGGHLDLTAGLTLVIGVVVGAWSAAMGLGGGSLTVPVLILLFGLGAHTAEGTSLLVMLPNSVTASVQHIRQRTASVPLGRTLAYGAAPGVLAGASLGLVLPATALDWVFGIFVLFIACQQLRRILAKRGILHSRPLGRRLPASEPSLCKGEHHDHGQS